LKTIPAGLASHYDGSSLTLAWCWKVTRTDGQVFAFTSHDQAITLDAVVYSASSVFDASAVSTLAELNVDDVEVMGLLDSSGITSEDIERGLWDGAAVEIRRVNWANIADGAEIIRVGEIGEIKREGLGFKAELRGLMQKLQRNIGDLISPLCNAEVGDTRCGKDMTSFTHTAAVTAVTSRREFTCSSLAQAAGYFANGKVTFTSGDNTGVIADVKNNASGVITLRLAVPFDIAVTDTISIVAGCDKRHVVATDGTMTGDCKNKFDNVLNFRGFWAVPGRDATMLVGGQ
jgi:uncharacterized phage protein (TIGR02218 family)